VSFIDTQTNAVKHVTYVGRSPHEAFFTPLTERPPLIRDSRHFPTSALSLRVSEEQFDG
jgi:DNA-binding beta-propeller fold protein YncE